MHWKSSLLSFAVAGLVSYGGDAATKGRTLQQGSDEPAPLVLKAEEPGPTFGLFYTPEVLAALAARHPARVVSVRINEAIRQRTPVIVMWRLPATADSPAPPRPYRMAILERAGDNPTAEVQKIEPLWIEQEATDLAALDERIGREEGGAMAAFPSGSLAPGRWVYIYSNPLRLEAKHYTFGGRWATLWER